MIEYLQKNRCLSVLDNSETILQKGEKAGHYREGYEGYGRLIERIAQTNHQSCLVLTSREKPQNFRLLEGKRMPVWSLQLSGLRETEGQELLEDYDLFGTKNMVTKFINLFWILSS